MAAVEPEEVVEEIIDIGEGVLQEGLIVKPAALVGVVTVGVVAGAAIGYAVAQRRLRLKFQQIAEDEIDEMREHFRARLVAREEKPSLEGMGRVVEELGYHQASENAGVNEGVTNTGKNLAEPPPEREGPAPRIPDPKTVVQNVFQEHADEWDYREELRKRDELHPYVIHKDEKGEKDYNEVTFTYYEKDDIICDESDKVVEEVEELLGNFAANFGHGSDDPSVVYIRNDRLAFDAEVCKSPNSYAEEVHGLQHAERPSRRMKFDDE